MSRGIAIANPTKQGLGVKRKRDCLKPL